MNFFSMKSVLLAFAVTFFATISQTKANDKSCADFFMRQSSAPVFEVLDTSEAHLSQLLQGKSYTSKTTRDYRLQSNGSAFVVEQGVVRAKNGEDVFAPVIKLGDNNSLNITIERAQTEKISGYQLTIHAKDMITKALRANVDFYSAFSGRAVFANASRSEYLERIDTILLTHEQGVISKLSKKFPMIDIIVQKDAEGNIQTIFIGSKEKIDPDIISEVTEEILGVFKGAMTFFTPRR